MFFASDSVRVTLALCVFMSGVAFAGTHELPKDWQGTEKGKTDNNPVAVDGKPQWRFVQAWPADLTKGENFIPLIWGGEMWQSDGHGYGGQPELTVNRNAVTLGSRGGWDGSEEKLKGGKWAGISFIAPKDGKYTVECTMSAKIWTGEGPMDLVILKIDKAKAVTEIQSVELIKGAEPAPLKDVNVDLLEGEEVVLVAQVKPKNTAANVKLADLKVVSRD